MSSTAAGSPNQGYPWRLFTAPTIHNGAPLALGRSHASWFLVHAHPHGRLLTRANTCLNFLVPGDARTVSTPPAANKVAARFTIGGSQGLEVLDTLRALRDKAGRAPVKVAGSYRERHPMSLQADVEVNVPEEELVRACARCGRWEAMFRPRFQRCAGCKSRYYCSQECQKDDWKPEFHKGECKLLRQGKAYEAERRRKLHDNGWWFNHGALGPESVLAFDERERALAAGDEDLLLFGRRTPPRDVPRDAPVSRTIKRSVKHENGEDDTSEDGVAQLTIDDIPMLPPLPKKPGFVPTGDPLVDDTLFWRATKRIKNVTVEQLDEASHLLTVRGDAMRARKDVAYERSVYWALKEARLKGVDIDEWSDSEEESIASIQSMPSIDTVSSSGDEWDSQDEGEEGASGDERW